MAQLKEEKVSPWIQFLPGIRGLLSVLVPAGLSPQGWFPVLGRSLSAIPALLEKETSKVLPRQPRQELPQEGKMKVSDIAGVQLMLCSHPFFSSVLIKTPHFPEDKLVQLVQLFGIKMPVASGKLYPIPSILMELEVCL